MKKEGIRIFVFNVCVPLLLGAIIYYLTSPQVLFVKQIDRLLGVSFHISFKGTGNLFLQFMRNHFLDMLWAYALFFALYFIIGNNIAAIKKTFLIAFSFSVIMEILQITPMVKGTFDVLDIVFELMAQLVAIVIIKFILLRRNSK